MEVKFVNLSNSKEFNGKKGGEQSQNQATVS